jgi:hypothetical protein
MSKWLKQFLFGVWGLLLIPLITPILEKWLEENVLSDPSGMATTVFRNAVATTVLDNLLALVQIWVGLLDRNRTWRLIGMVKPEVGREESFRTSEPRL